MTQFQIKSGTMCPKGVVICFTFHRAGGPGSVSSAKPAKRQAYEGP